MEHKEELEEGEISDDDIFSSYVPLERPRNLSVQNGRFPPVIKYSDSENSEAFCQSSDTDTSDGEEVPTKKKRTKKKLVPKFAGQNTHQMLKKYDIWSTRVQEDILAESITNFDVSLKDRSRNVEYYDIQFAKRHFEQEEQKLRGSKRTRIDRKNKNFKQSNSKATDKSTRDHNLLVSRKILDLQLAQGCSDEELAKDIANKLFENRDDLILKVIQVIGREKTIELFKRTKEIEADGGLLIMNMTRRRTPGGVFLFLVRNDDDITRSSINSIFQEDRQKHHEKTKQQKKLKMQKIKNQVAIERNKILPELLTRAQLLQQQHRKGGTDLNHEVNCNNPPPSPATDHHESCDDIDMTCKNEISNNSRITDENNLSTYDEDFLDLGCDSNIDLS